MNTSTRHCPKVIVSIVAAVPFTVLFIHNCLAGTIVSDPSLPQNLVSFWAFDEDSGTLRVDSRSTNNLNDNDNVGNTTGIVNKAALFSGNPLQYLSINDADQTGLDFTNDFTVSLWVNIHEEPAFQQQFPLVSKDENTLDRSYDIWYNNSVGTKQLAVVLFGPAYDGLRHDTVDLAWDEELGQNAWHHVVIVAHLSNQIGPNVEAFVDGVSIGYGTSVFGDGLLGSTLKDSSVPFTVGAVNFVPTGLNGALDEIGVWCRALTSDEVMRLYNNGTGLAYSESPTVLTQNLIKSVQALNVPTSQINAYLANLNKVGSFITGRKTVAATNQLEAFIRKVQTDINHGSLSAVQGDALIAAAQAILSAL